MAKKKRHLVSLFFITNATGLEVAPERGREDYRTGLVQEGTLIHCDRNSAIEEAAKSKSATKLVEVRGRKEYLLGVLGIDGDFDPDSIAFPVSAGRFFKFIVGHNKENVGIDLHELPG